MTGLTLGNPGHTGRLALYPMQNDKVVEWWDTIADNTITLNSGNVASWVGMKKGWAFAEATAIRQPALTTDAQGLKRLQFTSAGKRLSYSGGVPATLTYPPGFTIVVVMRHENGGSGNRIAVGNAFGNFYFTGSPNGVPTVYQGGLQTVSYFTHQLKTFITEINNTSSKMSIDFYTQSIGNPGGSDTGGSYVLGANGSYGEPLTGEIAAVMLLSGVPTTAERMDLLRFIGARYYRTQYLFKGDSITVGGGAGGYIVQLASALGFSNYFGMGVNSETIQTALANYHYEMRPRLSNAWGTQTIHVHEGTNDLALAGRTGTQAYNDYLRYCQLIRRDAPAGTKIIAATMLSRFNSDATKEGYRTTYNTNMRNQTSPPWDVIADYANEPLLGAQAAHTNATYFGDGVHPTTAGHTLMKNILQAVW